MPVWAPELAALTNDAAAARLRRGRGRRAARARWSLLIADVEALAPRDEPGPLATVFRQVLGRDWSAAGAAVVCTTSRPESVDPALRAPDLLVAARSPCRCPTRRCAASSSAC